MLERGHRGLWCVRKRSQRPGGSDGAVIVAGAVGVISERIVAGRQAPTVRPIAGMFAGILNAVLAIDPGLIAIVFKIVGIAIGQRKRVESHIGIMSEEERAAHTHADVKRDAEIGVAIDIFVAFF